jgi:uncharacterized membrane protein YfhO
MATLYKKLKKTPELQLLLFVFLICVILFAKYIFGGVAYLFTDIGSDTINAYYPSFYLNARLVQDMFSWYSFNIGVGAPILNNYTFDPFSFYLFLLPKDAISSGIVYSIILKILFVAFFAYRYFKELLPEANEYLFRIGSLAISFSGFFILWGQHYFLSSAFASLPLLFYGFELLLKGKCRWVFVTAIALSALSLYGFYQIGILSILYFLVRIFTYEGFHSFKMRVLFIAFRLIPFSLLGVALVAFSVVPSFFELKNSPRIHIDNINLFRYLTLQSSEFFHYSFYRLFSNNFMGNALNYNGFKNYYESPQLYSTLLILICIPQAFLIGNKKFMPLVVSLMLFLLFLIISPFLSVVINGMQYPSYRWGMLSSMAMIILGIIGLFSLFKSTTKLKLITLFLTSFILFILLLLDFRFIKSHHAISKLIEISVLLFVYPLTFFVLRKRLSILFPALLFILAIDIVTENYPTINYRKTINKNFEEAGEIYFDGYNDAIKNISKQDTTFFRLAKGSYSRFLNDPQVQAFNGITSYSSLNDPYYIRFIKKTGVPLLRNNVLNYIGQYDERPLLYDLLSVKYYLRRGSIGDKNLIYADSNGKIYGYLRKNYLPLGFTYSSFMLEENVKNYSDDLLLKTIILNRKPDLKINEMKSSDVDYLKEERSDLKGGMPISYTTQFSNIKESEGDLSGKLRLISTNIDPQIIVTIPKINTDATNITISFDLKSSQSSFCQVFWCNGDGKFCGINSISQNYKGDQFVHLSFIVNDAEIGQFRIDPGATASDFEISNFKIVNVPYKKTEIQQLYSQLRKDTLTITHFHPDNIKGAIHTDENKILFLSIPYNKGWKITNNAKKVQPLLANYGFMAIPLEKGNHSIELMFFPYGMKPGIILSVTASLLIFMYVGWEGIHLRKFFRRKRID